MTFLKTWKAAFTPKKKSAKDNANNGGAKRFLSRISGAFMLPISVMAIAGLFLGVGAAIQSQTSAGTFGQFIKNLGDPVFGAMPALFMVAIVISFTDDIGTAVFAGLIGFLVFNAIQTPFIQMASDPSPKGWTGGSYNQTGSAEIFFVGSNSDLNPSDWVSSIDETLGRRLFKLVGSNLGITSMNTSVFGGIIVGFVVAFAYNKFHEIELPSIISFFGGKRFVPFVVILFMIPLSLLFLIVWPWVGIGLAYFGEYSGKVAGLDSFVFGYVERALIPFGLHHVFYAPLWWTSAGGDVTSSLTSWQADGNALTGVSQNLISDLNGQLQGDSFIWLGVNGLSYDNITWSHTTAGGVTTQHSAKAFIFFKDELGINLGRFMQGKFPFMQFGLPAAGVAMVMAAPKENRKTAAAIIFPAALTSFVTGVTEPIEFTFVFLAPALFWGFHATMAAFSFLLMNLLGAHVGMTFSGGFIDTIIYGMIPVAKGTNFWWMYVIGAGLIPIYYFVFYWWIKHFNLSTPGRGGNTKLFTKADYKASKGGSSEIDPQAIAIIEAYGGRENIVKTANCATRLRFDVKDSSKVSEEKLKAAGAMGVMKVSKTHVQGIFGPKAEVLHGKIKKALEANFEEKTKVDSKTAKATKK
ncbi:MAG: PTS transporter subunit EIIC [Mycoplasmatales bacterium]|nr:PTS transporter subunit EIIC [Mycoplasmatales bacterium]